VKVTSLQFLVYDAQNLKKEWQRKLNLIEALISDFIKAVLFREPI